MWRVLLYLALLAVAAAGAVWLADNPETVSFTWAGREYTTSLAVAAVAILVLAMLLSLLWSIIRWVLNAPHRIGQGTRRRKRERGLTALSRGIIAVGAGDATTARRYANEAERLLGHQPLALLLKAQAAQAAGNRDVAETAFRDMAELPETRVLGLRGLFVEARRAGDLASARTYAEEAARVAPAVGWANDALLDAYSAEGNWSAALRSVERRSSLGLIDRETARRQRAVLHAADAIAKEQNDPDRALDAALEAARLAPDLVPAVALAARQLSRKGDLRRAAKLIETAWRQSQHPELAAAYLNLRPGDSALDRLRRAESLARLSSWSPESRLAIARAALDAREPARARDALQPLANERPSMRVCLAMAEVEQLDGATGRVREWLARAAHARRDKAWVADGVVSETWAPVSPISGRLDAFVWETPPEILGAPNAAATTVFAEPEPEPEPEPLPSLAPSVSTEAAVQPEERAASGAGPSAGLEPATLSAAKPNRTPVVLPPESVPAAPAEREAPPPLQVQRPDRPVTDLPRRDMSAATKRDVTVPSPPVDKPGRVAVELPPETVPAAPAPEKKWDTTPPPPLQDPGPPEPASKRRAPISVTTAPPPVVFPVSHPPDDPGADEEERPRRRLLG